MPPVPCTLPALALRIHSSMALSVGRAGRDIPCIQVHSRGIKVGHRTGEYWAMQATCFTACPCPTHPTGHGTAWHAVSCLSGLLAGSQNPSGAGFPRMGSLHVMWNFIRPVGQERTLDGVVHGEGVAAHSESSARGPCRVPFGFQAQPCQGPKVVLVERYQESVPHRRHSGWRPLLLLTFLKSNLRFHFSSY